MTQVPKGLPYLLNHKGFQIPFYSDEEYEARLLTEVLSGDRKAYNDLCADNLFALGKYDAIIAAVKEKYGYEND